MCAALMAVAQPVAWASDVQLLQTSDQVKTSLDGQTRAEGIREWIEIAEPGNLSLLMMGIAGLLIGRWAARNKRKGPPDK